MIREKLSVVWDSSLNRSEKVVAIGINPSIAQNGQSDTTMTKLCRFLDMYGFNNVTMLNLFESVSPDQSKITKNSKTDFNKKRELLDEADIILLVWGVEGYEEEKYARRLRPLAYFLFSIDIFLTTNYTNIIMNAFTKTQEGVLACRK